MSQRIDRRSPVPLYHQIAEALRNAIATGELRPHERLPPVRHAAHHWGVNMHTVRRAYAELAHDGLIRIDGARGTEVVGPTEGPAAPKSLDAFVASCIRTAHTEFGLTQLELGQLLLRQAIRPAMPKVYFFECSREQAAGHCAELEGVWRVDAHPVVLTEAADLPRGMLVATYFHYNEIRQRWPQRLDEFRFVAIAPDASLTERIAPGVRRLLVCELEESKALNIAADLASLVAGKRYAIEPRVLSVGTLPRTRPGDVTLVSPRLWGQLSAAQRARVLEIRYSIRAQEMAALGVAFGWEPRRGREAVA